MAVGRVGRVRASGNARGSRARALLARKMRGRGHDSIVLVGRPQRVDPWARLIDDSLENPHFQETYIRYDARTKQLEVDFVSTATSLLPPAYKRSAS